LTSSVSKIKQDGDNAIKSAIDSIRGMSPDALNTLQKIASAINNDANFATTITNALDGKANKDETYNKSEVETIAEQKASTKVSKNGDTINGRIVFAHDTNNKNTIRSIFPAHYYHNYWREEQRGVYIHAYPLEEPPEGDTYFAFRVATGNKRWHEYTLDKNGLSLNGKDLTASSIYADDWFRVNGENTGIHWQKYGGGWYMTDKEWIRAYNGKSIYTSGEIRCDAGFEGSLRGTADNANKLGGYTLEQVIAMAKR
ncbi:MAG: shufflon system plasmid conjugative transfer pilus tip adhesin PilV, partial [Capnocytophaga ochracea]